MIKNFRLEIQDSFVAPWGLSNEKLPLHILWEGNPDKLEITLPDQVSLVELHNTDMEVSEKDSNKVVIPCEELTTSGFIGGVLCVSKIHKKSVVPYNIEIRFYKGDVVQYLWHGTTHIIRPEIKIIDHPEEIRLRDGENNDIEIDMQYVGFGMAKVAFRVGSGGEIVPESGSLHHELLRAMLDTEFHKQDIEGMGEVPEEWKKETANGTDIEVPNEELDDIVEDMRKSATDDALLDEYSAQDLYEMADILEKAEESSSSDSTVASAIYSRVEMMLVDSILDIVDRHPTENVSLNSPQTRIKAEAKVTELEVIIRLSDKKNNEYEPKIIEIDIEDERDQGGIFESEIMTNWVNYEVNPEEVFN